MKELQGTSRCRPGGSTVKDVTRRGFPKRWERTRQPGVKVEIMLSKHSRKVRRVRSITQTKQTPLRS